MSKTVDERIVSMQFDNKQFESNVKTSMSTLDKLKQSLKLTDSAKGFENIGAAAKKIDMSPLSNGVETVRAKFSALEVMAVTALANITNSAVNTGKRIVSALTIDPIKSGFQEYETQINAVQTILANTSSKGTNLDQVNAALNELNTYADKTIYNFTEMTRNIGTFTAAGVDLNTSVNAIKGIANLAAVSGSTSQQASTAMYQLSQALAAGTVKLMDWNSVVNAGMGGQVFQDSLKETARVHGIAIDDMIESEGSFRETLQKGWLTSDILTETLSKFTGDLNENQLRTMGYTEEQIASIIKMGQTANDAATKVKTFTQLFDTLKEAAQSGWTKSWEIIIGDFGEAKELLTNMSNMFGDMIQKSADSRNSLLLGGLASGWKQLCEQGISDTAGFQEAITDVAKAHGVDINSMINDNVSFQDVLTQTLEEGKLSSKDLGDAISNLTDKTNAMSAEQLENAGYTREQVKALNELNEKVKDGSINLEEFAMKMQRPSGRENLIEALYNSLKAVGSVIAPIKEAFTDIFPPATGEQLYALTEKIRDFTAKLIISDSTAVKLKSTFKGVFSVLDIGVTALTSLGKGAVTLIGHLTGIGGGVLDITGSFGDFLTSIRNSIKESDIFGKSIDKIVGFLGNAIDKVKAFGTSIKESFTGAGIDGVSAFAKAISDIAKIIGSGIVTAISSIGTGIAKAFGGTDFFDVLNNGLLAGILVYMGKFIKNLTGAFDEGIGALENIKGVLDDVRGCFKAYQDQLKAGTLLKIASAIGILAAAIFVISTIDADSLSQSLGAITVLFVELVAALGVIGKMNSGVLNLSGLVSSLARIAQTIQMVGLATAVLILAGSMKILAGLDWNGVAKGLTGIAGMVTILVSAAKIMDSEYKTITKFAGQMILMSIAVGILAGIAKLLSTMSWEELGKAGAGMLGIITMLVGAAKMMDSSSAVITKFAGQMIIMSVAVSILAGVAKVLESMSWEGLGKAGAGIFGMIAMLVAAAKIMDNSSASITKFGGQMLLMSAAIAILVPALKSLGSMSLPDIGKGLLAMGGALAELAIGLQFMNGTLAGSAALLVAAGALAILTPVLKTLGSMSVESIVKSLVTLAGAFTVIGVAGFVLTPLVPVLLGLAGAFALFGLSMVGIGAGLTLIGIGLTSIAAAGTAAAIALVTSINIIISGILDLIPTIVGKISNAIIAFCDAIATCAPTIANTVLGVILEVLSAMLKYEPQIVSMLMTLLTNVMNSIADHLPELIKAAVNMIGNFFEGISDALSGIDTTNLLKGVLAVGITTALMYALAGVVALVPGAMLGLLGVGAVIAEMAIVLAAIGALAQIPGLGWLIGEGGDLLQKIGTAIGQFIGGIAGGVASGMTSSLPDVANNLSAFMQNIQPFIDGAKGIDSSVLDGITSLSKAILALTAADLLHGIASFVTGGNSMSDFARQLVPFGKAMKEYGDAVADIKPEAITNSATAAKALAELADNLPNSGGLIGKIVGENDIGDFARQLVPFGKAMKEYGDSVSGLKTDAITSSSTAGKALSELAESLPNSGGLASLFAGDNKLSTFAEQLIPFGKAMKEYGDSISGLKSDAVISSTTAAQALAELADNLPNSGGLVSLFSGDNTLATFGYQLVPFGKSMKEYGDSISGMDASAVEASANAAKVLAELANNIPAVGGLASLFTGDNSLSTFGQQLVPFGYGMKAYGDSISGLDSAAVEASANAGKVLSELASNLPGIGGLFSLFTGDNSLSTFGQQLVPFGYGMKAYGDSISGLNSSAVEASANAAKTLSELANNLPNTGGLVSLFVGDNSLSTFATQLVPFGKAMKEYSDAVAGISSESIAASASGAKALSELANNLQNSGGFVSLFTGDNTLSGFADQLVPFGKAMKDYASAVSGLDVSAIESSVTAANALSDLANGIQNSGGFVSLFSGEGNLGTLSSQLVPFGTSLKQYADSVAGLDVGAIAVSAYGAGQLVDVINNVSSVNFDGVSGFVQAVNTLGQTSVDGFVNAFSEAGVRVSAAISSMLSSGISAVNSQIGNFTTAGSSLTMGLQSGIMSGAIPILPYMTSLMVNVITEITSRESTFNTAGMTLMTSFASGIDSGGVGIVSSISSTLDSCVSAINGYYTSFQSAGTYLGQGLTSGIAAQETAAYNAGFSLGQAAVKGENDGQQSKSPSKLTKKAGVWLGEGLVIGMEQMGKAVYNSGKSMGENAVDSISNALTNIPDIANIDMDAQPTIRPVLDLTDVQNGFGAIDGLFRDSASTMTVSSNIAPKQTNMADTIGDVLNSALSKFDTPADAPSDATYVIEIPVNLEGREIARASAPFMQPTLDRMNRNKLRKGGTV